MGLIGISKHQKTLGNKGIPSIFNRLQNLVHRFKSGSRLQPFTVTDTES